MAKIVKVYREKMPDAVLIGKVYHDEDRNAQQTFSSKWAEWFQKGWFDTLCALNSSLGEDYVGAMRMNGDVFEYWIGMIMKSGTKAPDGFEEIAVAGSDYAVAWIKGHDDGQLYSMHEDCMKAFADGDYKLAASPWYIERYNCPRFTQPDENGEVILDYMTSLK